WLDEAEIAPSGFTAELPARGLAVHPVPAVKPDGPLDFIATLAALDAILPEDRILVVDAGRFMVKTLEYIGVSAPRRMVHTANIGSIGLGMAYAIGAGAADPGRQVVLFVGDGGFMLGGLAE